VSERINLGAFRVTAFSRVAISLLRTYGAGPYCCPVPLFTTHTKAGATPSNLHNATAAGRASGCSSPMWCPLVPSLVQCGSCCSTMVGGWQYIGTARHTWVYYSSHLLHFISPNTHKYTHSPPPLPPSLCHPYLGWVRSNQPCRGR
jgi:hypothetical protein